MRLTIRILVRLFLLFVLSQMLCLCNKMDLTKEHTALGRNLLSFSIDGTTVTQGYTGTVGSVQFQRGIWYDSPCTSFAKFYVDDDGYIRTRAVLVSPRYQELRMKLPTRDIKEGVSYNPEVSLYYKYLARIKSGQNTTVREAEFRKATITDASIIINTFYPERDESGANRPYRAVLSGEFSFSGHFVDSLGKVVSFKAENGRFDLSDQSGIWLPLWYRWQADDSGWDYYDDLIPPEK